MRFTVCVLCYGDYPHLIRKCLQSIVAATENGKTGWQSVHSFRIGMNEASPETQIVVRDLRDQLPAEVRSRSLVFTPDHNVGKYPLMRRMLYDPAAGTEWVMWFDDDSYLLDRPHWWSTVEDAANRCDLIGLRKSISLWGNQHLGIQAQKWYRANPPVQRNQRVVFPQGGWWAARLDLLRRWDYPFPALHHNGGDVLLGQLAKQQNWRWSNTLFSVLPNAGTSGKESGAKRRGMQTRTPWENWTPEPRPCPHQFFDCNVIGLDQYGVIS